MTPPHCLPALTASSTLPAFLTAASALWSGTRFIYIQCAVAQEGAIQGSDGFVAIFRACHLHEAEPARLVGIPIPDDGHSVHPSVMRKQLADGLFTCIEVEISDENVLHGNRPPHLSSPEQRSPDAPPACDPVWRQGRKTHQPSIPKNLCPGFPPLPE